MKSFNLRADEVIFKKIEYIAEKESRSINKEIVYLIQKEITRYELDHGKIDL